MSCDWIGHNLITSSDLQYEIVSLRWWNVSLCVKLHYHCELLWTFRERAFAWYLNVCRGLTNQSHSPDPSFSSSKNECTTCYLLYFLWMGNELEICCFTFSTAKEDFCWASNKKIVPLSNSHSICELSTVKFLYQTIYTNHHWLAGLGNEMWGSVIKYV